MTGIPKAPRDGDLPLSFAQSRLWLLDQLGEDSRVYNIRINLMLRGAVDVGALEWAFGQILRRHEALRTTFEQGDEAAEPRQVVHAPGDFALRVEDCSEADDPEAEARRNRAALGFLARSVGESEQRVKREAVLPSEFLTLPPTTTRSGLTGYYLTPELGAFRRALPLSEMLGETERNRDVADLEPRELERDGELLPWREGRANRLGLGRSLATDCQARRPRLRLLRNAGASR